MNCDVLLIRGTADQHGEYCEGKSIAECSDCGSHLCESHLRRCGLCGAPFCPGCHPNHAEEHLKPPQVERWDRIRKKAG